MTSEICILNKKSCIQEATIANMIDSKIYKNTEKLLIFTNIDSFPSIQLYFIVWMAAIVLFLSYFKA